MRQFGPSTGKIAKTVSLTSARYRESVFAVGQKRPFILQMNPTSFKPASVAAQALGWIDDKTRAISPGIQTATTYLRDEDNQFRSGRVYARADNPTFDQPEALLNHLEQGAGAA